MWSKSSSREKASEPSTEPVVTPGETNSSPIEPASRQTDFQAKIGKTIDVLIDEVDEEGAIGRSRADAPEIDGMVYLNGETELQPGQIVQVVVEHADEHDLWAVLA